MHFQESTSQNYCLREPAPDVTGVEQPDNLCIRLPARTKLQTEAIVPDKEEDLTWFRPSLRHVAGDGTNGHKLPGS